MISTISATNEIRRCLDVFQATRDKIPVVIVAPAAFDKMLTDEIRFVNPFNGEWVRFDGIPIYFSIDLDEVVVY